FLTEVFRPSFSFLETPFLRYFPEGYFSDASASSPASLSAGSHVALSTDEAENDLKDDQEDDARGEHIHPRAEVTGGLGDKADQPGDGCRSEGAREEQGSRPTHRLMAEGLRKS